MTRIKISAVILCVLVGISIFFTVWINKRCSYMLDEITGIFQLMDSGQNIQAMQRAEALDNEWNSFRKKATIMLNNQSLTEVDCISSGIPYLIKNDNDESYARLMEFKYILIMIKDGEVPTLTRVL
ncbi:MAG: DUF4363 family protein [Ruminococcus sp.]|nr:DUF4363 family protein [Ruminococcus sp.]